MAAPLGHPRYGGRTRGKPNRASQRGQAEIAASGLTPIDFLLMVLRDEKLDMSMRVEAARTVAPYVHPRLAVIDATVKTEVEVSPLTEEQRRERARQMILEAFAERPPIVEGKFRVIAGRDVATVNGSEIVGENVGSANAADANQLKSEDE